MKIRFCVVAFTYCPLKSRPSVFWNEMCFCVSSAVSQMKAWCLWPRWFWQLNSFWLLSTCTVWSLLLSPGHKSCQLLVIVTRSKLFVYLYIKKKNTILTLQHFQQSVSWEETENYFLQPNVSGVNLLAQEGKKVSEVLRKWLRRVWFICSVGACIFFNEH